MIVYYLNTKLSDSKNRMRYNISLISFLLFSALFSSCYQSQISKNEPENKLTAGVVQKEIKKGMPQSQVVTALGSPNIVTRDTNGQETWVYDKIASTATYSNENSGFGIGGGAGAVRGSSLILGILGASSSRESGAYSTSQRTLTVIIKFTVDSKVDQFSFHQSSF